MRSRSLSLLFALLLHTAAAVAQTPADQVRAAGHPLTDYGALMDAIGDRRVVLMGEASHGTAEFYRERARITRQLIEEKQFRAVVLEASWSDVERVDAYTRGAADRDPLLEFHARVVMNAEAFYRAAASGRSSWNMRDTHMTETLAAYGDVNIGQLVRQRWPGQSFHIGLSMYGGTVMAAHSWGGAGEVMALRPADPSLVGALFHSAGIGDFYLLTRQVPALAEGRWQRAVGVLYRPLTERQSHFIWGTPANQYDAMIHIEESHAVTPLTGWLQSRRRAVRTP